MRNYQVFLQQYQLIKVKKIRAAQNVFDKVIKQVPSTDRKKSEINYYETNNIKIEKEERNDWRKRKKTWRKKFMNLKFI